MVEHEGQWQGFETQISRYVDDGILPEAKPGQIADGMPAIIVNAP